jgi:zinc protease
LEPVVQKTLEKVSYDRIFQIYQECFSNASDFKTVIIGNYDEQELRQLVCQYLASLPSSDKHSSTNYKNVPQIIGGDFATVFKKKMATPLANVSIYHTADIPFSAKSDLELDFLNRVLQIAYTDSVREEKGGTYGVRVAVGFDKDDVPTALLRISYNADPSRYEELNPIVYQQLQNIAAQGPQASSMDKVRKYLLKQYDQVAITNDYWSYIIWHELEDGVDFDKDYKKMVNEVTAEQVQRMAQQILASKRRIEVTMLSE